MYSLCGLFSITQALHLMKPWSTPGSPLTGNDQSFLSAILSFPQTGIRKNKSCEVVKNKWIVLILISTRFDLRSWKHIITDLLPKRWLKFHEVRKMVKISAGTLQHLRNSEQLKFRKWGRFFLWCERCGGDDQEWGYWVKDWDFSVSHTHSSLKRLFIQFVPEAWL